MSEVFPDKVVSADVISYDGDSDDLIQSHIDSFIPPVDPKEGVIEKENLDELLDEEKDISSGSVVGIISGEVSYDDAEKILEMILHSEENSEDQIANYTVLDTPVNIGLAPDVIRLIPWTGFEMDDQGSGPESWSDFFGEWLGYLADAAELLKEGLVAIGNFIVNLGEAIVDWGMAVVGGIKDAFSAVRDAVSEVVELLSSLVNWVKDFVRGYIGPIFEDIKDYMVEYIEGVIASYEEALKEFDETGSLSEATAKKVFDSLMDDMFYIIFGLTTALMVVFTVLEGVSLGAGSIAMIAVPLLVTMIIDIFGETVGEAELPGLPSKFDVESIIDYAKSLVGMGEESINRNDASDALWSIASIVFGWYGFIGGAISLEGTPNPGTWSIYSVVCGFISLLFGFYSLAATGLAELITGGIALIYGTASSILGIGATVFGPTGTIKGAGIFGTALGIGATVSGGKAFV